MAADTVTVPKTEAEVQEKDRGGENAGRIGVPRALSELTRAFVHKLSVTYDNEEAGHARGSKNDNLLEHQRGCLHPPPPHPNRRPLERYLLVSSSLRFVFRVSW